MTDIPFRNRTVSQTPVAVVDVETTGLVAGQDKIVEIAIARIDPGESPRVVLETLVNPRQRVRGTEIHGITDQDVKGAPEFSDLTDTILRALDGAVLASYNVYFDVRFLQAELLGSLDTVPPHICLMYMRPLLRLGKRTTLADACREHGIAQHPSHTARQDVEAAAGLWHPYLDAMQNQEIVTFHDLARQKKYKFSESFDGQMVTHSSVQGPTRLKPRLASPPPTAGIDPLRSYWDLLLTALDDFELSNSEIKDLISKQQSLGITPQQIRWVHARAFAFAIQQFGRDEAISDAESVVLSEFAAALDQLGWAPGYGARRAQPPTRGLLARLFGW